MRPNRYASAAAWVVVAVLVGAITVQNWPQHQDRSGFRSELGIAR